MGTTSWKTATGFVARVTLALVLGTMLAVTTMVEQPDSVSAQQKTLDEALEELRCMGDPNCSW
jgi:hypothetical protein